MASIKLRGVIIKSGKSWLFRSSTFTIELFDKKAKNTMPIEIRMGKDEKLPFNKYDKIIVEIKTEGE